MTPSPQIGLGVTHFCDVRYDCVRFSLLAYQKSANMLCILTSSRVLRAPESWSKHFFSHFQPVVQTISFGRRPNHQSLTFLLILNLFQYNVDFLSGTKVDYVVKQQKENKKRKIYLFISFHFSYRFARCSNIPFLVSFPRYELFELSYCIVHPKYRVQQEFGRQGQIV